MRWSNWVGCWAKDRPCFEMNSDDALVIAGQAISLSACGVARVQAD